MQLPFGLRRRRAECDRHAPALLELVEQGIGGPEVERALDHVAVCAECRGLVESSVLVIAGLRRMGASARTGAAQRGQDRWPELRRAILADSVRAEHPAARPRLSLGGLAGALVAPAIVAVVFAWSGGLAGPAVTPAPDIEVSLPVPAVADRAIARPLYEPELQLPVRAVLIAPAPVRDEPEAPGFTRGAAAPAGSGEDAGTSPAAGAVAPSPLPVVAGVPI